MDIQDRIFPCWRELPLTWGGMDEETITQRIVTVIQKLGFTTKQLKKLSVILSDASPVRVHGAEPIYRSASCFAYHDDNDTIDYCHVLFNRAKHIIQANREEGENAPYLDPKKESFKQMDLLDNTITEKIVCYYKTAEEAVWHDIIEELTHARDFLRAGTLSEVQRRQDWYTQKLMKLGTRFGYLYDIDKMEVDASRECMRILAEIYKVSAPDRAAYFMKLYQKSLDTFLHITPHVPDSMLDEIYIDVREE